MLWTGKQNNAELRVLAIYIQICCVVFAQWSIVTPLELIEMFHAISLCAWACVITAS